MLPTQARAPTAEESHVPFQVAVGLAGAVLLSIPSAYAGYQIGDRLAPAEWSCEGRGGECTYSYPYGGMFGLFAGGVVGLSVGTGLGVATAGLLLNRPLQLFPAIGGAVAGGFLGLFGGTVACLALGATGLPILGLLGLCLVPSGLIAGALVGSIRGYEGSLLSSPVKVTPTVALVPGGGMVGISGTL